MQNSRECKSLAFVETFCRSASGLGNMPKQCSLFGRVGFVRYVHKIILWPGGPARRRTAVRKMIWSREMSAASVQIAGIETDYEYNPNFHFQKVAGHFWLMLATVTAKHRLIILLSTLILPFAFLKSRTPRGLERSSVLLFRTWSTRDGIQHYYR